MRSSRSSLLALLVAVVVLSSLPGCGKSNTGPKRIAVFGAVKGMPNGSISFLPNEDTKGPSATASIINGKYQFDTTNGPVAGNYNVVIASRLESPIPKKPAQGETGLSAKQAALPAKNAERPLSSEDRQQSFPATLNDQTKQLDFEVK